MAEQNLLDSWAAWAAADADRRDLPGLKPVLQAFARAAGALRAADWNRGADADAVFGTASHLPRAPGFGEARRDG